MIYIKNNTKIGLNMQKKDCVGFTLFVVIAFALIANPVFASSQNKVGLHLDEALIVNTGSNEIGDNEYTIYKSYRFLTGNWIDNSGEQIAEIRFTFTPLDEKIVKDKSSWGACSFNQIENTLACRNVLEDDGAGMDFRIGSQKITPPFLIKREVNNMYFESTGTQVLTVKLTPKSSFDSIGVSLNLYSPDADVKVLSTSMDYIASVTDVRVGFEIDKPQKGKEYVFKATIQITPKKGKVSYIPGVWAEFREINAQTTSIIGKRASITSDFGTGEAVSLEDLNFFLYIRKYYAVSFNLISVPVRFTVEGDASTPAPTTMYTPIAVQTSTPILTPTLAPTIGKELNTKSQLSEGLNYFAFPALISLVVFGIVFVLEKREKNKYRFRDDLKTKHWLGYYAALIGQFITGIIFMLISFVSFFKELPSSFDAGKFIFTIPIFYLSISSFILAIGLRTSKPIIKLNSLHFIISLLMGIFTIFIILADPQKSPPVIFPVLLMISSGVSIWYDRVAIVGLESIQESVSVEKSKEKSTMEPAIKRGYAVLPNNDIKFGIRVTNSTGYTITDVDTILDYTEELFKLKKSKIQRIGNIPPETARTAEYILKPLGCIHNEKINALISYTDATGNKHAIHMRPREVHCVCPFLKEKPMSEGEYSRLAASSEFVQEGISFKGISVEELSKFMGETCRHMLYKVKEYDIEGKKVIYLSGESLGEKAYYLLTAVIQEYKGLTQVVLRAHSDKKYGLNGFMNEIADSIRHLVSSVQSAKEIGIIENTQVINIIDSVVQRTSFEMGEGGNTQVNIKDSMVQRSNIAKNKQ